MVAALILLLLTGLVLALSVYRERERVWYEKAARGVNALVQDGHCIHDRVVEGVRINCPYEGCVNKCIDCWCVAFGLDENRVRDRLDRGVKRSYIQAEPDTGREDTA